MKSIIFNEKYEISVFRSKIIIIFTIRNRTEQNGVVNLDIDLKSDIPRYQQLVNGVNNALATNLLSSGDSLPSVNRICKDHNLSRDTVFKAYTILKETGVVESVPNKGYYVANDTRKVLLVLDTFKAYKEVLYHSFINNLPKNVIVDVHFHHYSIDTFKTVLNNGKGKYYKYVVMAFDNDEIASTLSEFENDKLLLIDWNIHSTASNNYVFQDFGKSFVESLKDATGILKKYTRLVFIYPSFTSHPSETVDYFKKYCQENQFKFEVITNENDLNVLNGHAYLSVSDRMLGLFLEQCKKKGLEPGNEVGFLSYNDTPMKKFIYKGISVVSTDFKAMGAKAAEFISNSETMQTYVPTKLILRDSL